MITLQDLCLQMLEELEARRAATLWEINLRFDAHAERIRMQLDALRERDGCDDREQMPATTN